jgi:hypothetical protein
MNQISYSVQPGAKWDSDSFENQIAGTIIALYERPTRIHGSDWPGIGVDELEKIRKRGAYVQHPNRMVFNDELDAPLDAIYSGLFVESAVQLKQRFELAPEVYGGFSVLKRAPSIPRPFYPVSPGTPYCYIGMSATDDGGLETDKQYFTVRGRSIFPCAIDGGKRKRWNYTYRPTVLGGLSLAENTAKRVIMTANTIADRLCQWGIESSDSGVNVELQCYHDEVKSLLYARSLPMTSTGRKRPILHLVAAHRRRIKEGIEIDIEQFLRGVRKVEMGGAIFEVRSPQPLPAKRVPNVLAEPDTTARGNT